MHNRLWSIIAAGSLALSVAACSGDAPAEAPDETQAGELSQENALDKAEVPVMGPEKRILAFGNSLFAGYGVDEGESYPAQLENALRARGINARVVNAGVSGDTTAAGRQRLAFTLDAQADKPDLFILELGGNDMLRQITPDQTRANIAAMLDELRSRGIPVLLMGMRAPPNLGPEYQADFDGLYRELAREYGTALIPFWLEDIYQRPELFQSDRVHPTSEGIGELVGSTVDQVAEAVP